jgi:hypothetical protein
MPFETPDLLDEPVPERTEAPEFLLRPLTMSDVDIDYEAVMASRDRIRGTFGPDDEWPSPDLTREQDRIDLGWHEKEFQRRDAFTYAVTDHEETVELGCLYVQPTTADYDAAVYFWVSDAAVDRGLESAIESHIREWIREAWPFDQVAYPGRDIPWDEWGPVK